MKKAYIAVIAAVLIVANPAQAIQGEQGSLDQAVCGLSQTCECCQKAECSCDFTRCSICNGEIDATEQDEASSETRCNCGKPKQK